MKPHIHSAVIVASLFVMFAGCGKKNAPDQAPAPEPAAAAAPSDPAPTDAPPPPPVPGGVAPEPAATAPAEEKEDSLTQIKHAIQGFAISQERPPKDLNELVRMKYLKSIPAAPPGKKFVYDPNGMSIKLVNQ